MHRQYGQLFLYPPNRTVASKADPYLQGSIPRKGFNGFCLDDGAAGVRRAREFDYEYPQSLD